MKQKETKGTRGTPCAEAVPPCAPRPSPHHVPASGTRPGQRTATSMTGSPTTEAARALLAPEAPPCA